MVNKIESINMAHLHIGSSGEQGTLAAWLYPLEDHSQAKPIKKRKFDGILAEGIIKSDDLENGVTFEHLIASMRNDDAYVNIHTREYLAGEIRGQVFTEQNADFFEIIAPAAGL